MVKAAIFHGVRKPQSIEAVELDEPRDHEVLVRTIASGVCHSDLHYIEGTLPMGIPAILGHESSGIVEKAGKKVTSVKVGDHVIACGSAFCGSCSQCLTGNPHRCETKPFRTQQDTPRVTLKGTRVHASASNINGFAEQMLLHENGVVRVRDDMPLDVGALVGCGVITGVGAALNTAKVAPGSSVAVFGVGGVGVSVVQGAYIAGARQIIAVDLLDEKLEAAKQFGATHTVNGRTEDPVARIRALSNGGVDYAFDAIGLSKVTMQCVESLGVGGTATIIGVISADDTIPLGGRMLAGEKKLQACTMGSNRFKVDMPKLIELYMQGRLKLDEMVSRRGSLEDVNDMFHALESGKVARQIIVFD